MAREGFSETVTFEPTHLLDRRECLVQASEGQAFWAEVLRLSHTVNSRHSRRPAWPESMSKER